MNILFSELKVRDIKIRNRIALSPMCQYTCTDGLVGDWQLIHLGSRAAGGAGLIMTEATAVSPEGRISPWDAGIWKDDHINAWMKVFSAIKSFGAVPGIQLAHAGRKASADYPWKGGNSIHDENGWQTLSPTAEAFGLHLDKVPKEMNETEIKKLIQDFAFATIRASLAGAEWLEIHAGHGYLLHEFLSPLTNKRTDDYGGSFSNRIRILLEITQAVRSNWPDHLPLAVRLSSTDWDENGWTPEDSVELSLILKRMGVDLIDVSSGFVAPAATFYPIAPNWQVHLSSLVKNKTSILTGAVGMINTGKQAEDILQKNEADLIFIGREFLRQPNWPMIAAKELQHDVTKVGAINISHWIR